LSCTFQSQAASPTPNFHFFSHLFRLISRFVLFVSRLLLFSRLSGTPPCHSFPPKAWLSCPLVLAWFESVLCAPAFSFFFAHLPRQPVTSAAARQAPSFLNIFGAVLRLPCVPARNQRTLSVDLTVFGFSTPSSGRLDRASCPCPPSLILPRPSAIPRPFLVHQLSS
jgi:hypothetical protein